MLSLDLDRHPPADFEPLDRISRLEAALNDISDKFRRFLITHHGLVSGRISILAGVINRDLDEWESVLSRFGRDNYPTTSPPGLEAAIIMSPLPVSKGMAGFVNGGGE